MFPSLEVLIFKKTRNCLQLLFKETDGVFRIFRLHRSSYRGRCGKRCSLCLQRAEGENKWSTHLCVGTFSWNWVSIYQLLFSPLSSPSFGYLSFLPSVYRCLFYPVFLSLAFLFPASTCFLFPLLFPAALCTSLFFPSHKHILSSMIFPFHLLVLLLLNVIKHRPCNAIPLYIQIMQTWNISVSLLRLSLTNVLKEKWLAITWGPGIMFSREWMVLFSFCRISTNLVKKLCEEGKERFLLVGCCHLNCHIHFSLSLTLCLCVSVHAC